MQWVVRVVDATQDAYHADIGGACAAVSLPSVFGFVPPCILYYDSGGSGDVASMPLFVLPSCVEIPVRGDMLGSFFRVVSSR